MASVFRHLRARAAATYLFSIPARICLYFGPEFLPGSYERSHTVNAKL